MNWFNKKWKSNIAFNCSPQPVVRNRFKEMSTNQETTVCLRVRQLGWDIKPNVFSCKNKSLLWTVLDDNASVVPFSWLIAKSRANYFHPHQRKLVPEQEKCVTAAECQAEPAAPAWMWQLFCRKIKIIESSLIMYVCIMFSPTLWC